ncbi:uncharacterized protein N7473_003221 [Penicillium subrubescens]|uniref:uncharacterized protein n=1 Tax=Penicillium subrubescens TaxID=1316194 RepID=UPI002545B807|nr:uncharacterized protein N7473_003221 [Penicillium subrubescens]KAJ5906305.1 hypothetical protein N7473_003221 [Penicillium subrubescens]
MASAWLAGELCHYQPPPKCWGMTKYNPKDRTHQVIGLGLLLFFRLDTLTFMHRHSCPHSAAPSASGGTAMKPGLNRLQKSEFPSTHGWTHPTPGIDRYASGTVFEGKKLWELCSSFKHAKCEIAKQILHVKNHWMRVNL